MKLFGLFFSFLMLAMSCGGGDEARPVSRIHEVALTEERPDQMTTAERFGPEPAATPTPAPIQRGYQYQLPEGWMAAQPRPMREMNFAIDGEPEIECYATALKGKAGGIKANVTRWCRQMGVQPLAPADLDRCEKFPMLGGTGLVIELRGSYTGMDRVKHSGWGLIGVVCPQPDRTVFVKMTGPADAIAAQRESMVLFCKSLRTGS